MLYRSSYRSYARAALWALAAFGFLGWNDSTALVTSVTDSKGNAYNLAIGPTVLSGQASQAIYFAPNIASATANSNIVTVRFSAAAVYPDVRILEYSGLDPVSPLHAVAASSGSSATSSSGALNVSLANVLLVAGNIVATTTSGPGASFTNRVITSPNGDIAEDRVAAAAGSYSATAPLEHHYRHRLGVRRHTRRRRPVLPRRRPLGLRGYRSALFHPLGYHDQHGRGPHPYRHRA